MTRLKVYRNDDELILISGAWTESDWPVYFVVELVECAEYDREWARRGKYHVELSAVSPKAAGLEGCKQAAASYGADIEEFRNWDIRGQVECLHSYGIKAVLWDAQGNNRDKLLRQARAELRTVASFTFGFAMDRTVNAIGESGWDWITGGPGSTLSAV